MKMAPGLYNYSLYFILNGSIFFHMNQKLLIFTYKHVAIEGGGPQIA